MKENIVDPARISLLLNELRLPATKVIWPQFAEQADKEGWPAARFLAALAEHELADDRRAAEDADGRGQSVQRVHHVRVADERRLGIAFDHGAAP